MLVWSGWGILVVPITLVVGGAITALVGAILPGAAPDQVSTGGLGLGLMASAAVTWWAGRHFNGREGRVLLDPATGQRVVLRRRHSLFFVPMQWWAVPLTLIGVQMLVAGILVPNPPDGAIRPPSEAGQTHAP